MRHWSLQNRKESKQKDMLIFTVKYCLYPIKVETPLHSITTT